MTAWTSPPRSERSSLAQLLRDHARQIIQAWRRQAAILPQKPCPRRPYLQKALPEILETIACLAESGEEAPALLEAWRRQVVARLEEGHDPKTMIQEYQLLLDCILRSQGEEAGGRLRSDELLFLTHLFNEAALETISRFVACTQKSEERRASHLSRQAKKAARTLDELLALISHDLRDPLGAMMMSAALFLRASHFDDDPKRARRHAEMLHNAAERMSHLLRDLLDFASIEADALRLEKKVQDAEALLDTAFQILEPLATHKQIRCRKKVSAEDLFVFGDPQRVLQVFSRLVQNAVTCTPPGGTITLRAAPRQREVLFSVSDTGPGVTPAILPPLFAPDARSGEDREGGGLGLYLARSIVEAQGGRLWVKSLLGVGSTFFFTLPTRQAALGS